MPGAAATRHRGTARRSLALLLNWSGAAAVADSPAAPPTTGGVLTRTLVAAASPPSSTDAVCLDGSQPGYYFRQGDSSRVLIGLLGGGWCDSPQECHARSKTVYGTSSKWPKTIRGLGLTSDDLNVNPAFAKWTIAFLWYCDGTSYMSDMPEPVSAPDGSKLYFRGRRIFDAVISDLKRSHGLGSASQVVLYGESAGGYGCYAHLDGLAAALPHARVRGVCDSSFTGDEGGTIPATLQSVYTRYNLAPAVDKSCAASYPNAPDRWRCLLPQVAYPHITTEMFVLNSLYDCMHLRTLGLRCLPAPNTPKGVAACNETEVALIQQNRRAMLAALAATGATSGHRNGVYADACIHHSIALFGGYWNSQNWRVQGTTAAAAVAKWIANAPSSPSPAPTTVPAPPPAERWACGGEGKCVPATIGHTTQNTCAASCAAPTPQTRYACGGRGQCYQKPGANATDLAACNEKCARAPPPPAPPAPAPPLAYWDCGGRGVCVSCDTGHASKEKCEASCKAPAQGMRYTCGGRGACFQDPDGRSETLAACETGCIPPAPPASAQDVHVDAHAFPDNTACTNAFQTCLGVPSEAPWQCGSEPWQVPNCDPWGQ